MKRLAFYISQFALPLSTFTTGALVTKLPNGDPWASAYTKAAALLSNMTLSELNNITIGFAASAGVIATGSACSGLSGSVIRLGYPGLCFQDAGNGVRNQDGVSAFASGISVGASWNVELAFDRAKHMGAEFQRKGVNVILGPVVGPMGRVAEGGRNWEGFGSDPYLNGNLVMPTIKGLQESVIACTKHFILNEQETNRSSSITNPLGLAVSSNVDDKTMHELYLWPFHDAVNAGTGSVMCSYNRINNTYACNNDKAQNGLLKDELAFRGFVVSDWSAQHSGLDTAQNGLDVVMPTSQYWDNNQLANAVRNGSLDRSRLEDMALRTIATWYQLKQDSPDLPALGSGLTSNISQPHSFVDARDPASAPSLLQQAQEGHVLVKNSKNALPLNKPHVLSVFGYDAKTPEVSSPRVVTGIFAPGASTDLTSINFQNLNDNETYRAFVEHNYTPNIVDGLLISGGGSGTNTPPYISSPIEALTQRAIIDGTQIFSDFSQIRPSVVSSSEACLVFLNAYATEAWDRLGGLSDNSSDTLVLNVASQCENTMVFIHNAGIRIVDAWIDHPNVTAVMYAHLPGQDAGRALVSLLYGDVSPSGRLPYTVARKDEDYGSLLGPCIGALNETSPQCHFSEGVNIDYRYFLAKNVTPRFEFGYGLTYSEFNYSDLAVRMDNLEATGLFEVVGNITLSLENVGTSPAAEVSQLYIHIPGADTRVLRGFSKTLLGPGDQTTITFCLRKKDISSWDVISQQWLQPSGQYRVYVGASVLDIKLESTFRL